MTRILLWNIDNFDLLKINNALALAPEPGYGVTQAVASVGRNNYILDNFTFLNPEDGTNVRPDIIVIVEVSTEDTYNIAPGRGILANGLGGRGALTLLDRIRVVTGNNQWMLVPPLQTGAREAVAVFYDSRNYGFAGPWFWPGGNGPSQAAGPGQNYPDLFQAGLPDRNIPNGLPNQGVSERLVAAATGFTWRADAGAGIAGQPIQWANNIRTPYWVTFGQVDYGPNPPVLQRTLSLFVSHGPAGNRLARNFLQALADVQEIISPPAQNEIKVVLGDFNLNLTAEQQGPPAQIVQAPEYQGLTNAGYAMALNSPNPVPSGGQGPFTGYRGYLATHVRPIDRATYWYIGNNADYYPGYGVIGDGNSATRNYSLDNILVKFGDNGHGQPCGVLQNVTILNGTVPPPFNVVPNPPPQDVYIGPFGYYQWPLQMANNVAFGNPPAQILGPADPGDPRIAALPQWNNYGHIRCTSDHMPLVADI